MNKKPKNMQTQKNMQPDAFYNILKNSKSPTLCFWVFLEKLQKLPFKPTLVTRTGQYTNI